MPKANHGGATFYGYEGVVLDSHDRPSELDPSRNVDGSVVDGYESDERDLTDRKDEAPAVPVDAPVPAESEKPDEQDDESESADKGEKEVPSSPGHSSKASPASLDKSEPKTLPRRR